MYFIIKQYSERIASANICISLSIRITCFQFFHEQVSDKAAVRHGSGHTAVGIYRFQNTLCLAAIKKKTNKYNNVCVIAHTTILGLSCAHIEIIPLNIAAEPMKISNQQQLIVGLQIAVRISRNAQKTHKTQAQ